VNIRASRRPHRTRHRDARISCDAVAKRSTFVIPDTIRDPAPLVEAGNRLQRPNCHSTAPR